MHNRLPPSSPDECRPRPPPLALYSLMEPGLAPSFCPCLFCLAGIDCFHPRDARQTGMTMAMGKGHSWLRRRAHRRWDSRDASGGMRSTGALSIWRNLDSSVFVRLRGQKAVKTQPLTRRLSSAHSAAMHLGADSMATIPVLVGREIWAGYPYASGREIWAGYPCASGREIWAGRRGAGEGGKGGVCQR